MTNDGAASAADGAMPISFRDAMDAAPIGRWQWAIALMLAGVMMLEGLDLQISAFSAPPLMAQWHLSKPQFSPLLAAALVGMAFGTLIGSWAGDRLGRRRPLVASVAFFGVMTMLCATAQGPAMFVALRFLSGLGFGTAFPIAMAMMSEWMPRRAAGKAVSIMTIGIPVGIMVGAASASWVLPQYGWHSFFVGVGALCVLFSALLGWRLPESPSFLILQGRHGQAHALLARAWGRVVGNGRDVFQIDARRGEARGLLARGNRRVNVGLWLAVLSNSFATYAMGGWLTLVLVDLKLPLATALRGPLIVSVAAICGALAIGWALARLGSRVATTGLALVAATCALAMSLASHALPPGPALFTILFAGLAVGGLCSGALQPAFYVLAASAYETRLRSRGIGVAAGMGRVGAIFSSFVGAAALGVGGASGFFALIALLSLGAAAAILVVDRHMPRDVHARERGHA